MVSYKKTASLLLCFLPFFLFFFLPSFFSPSLLFSFYLSSLLLSLMHFCLTILSPPSLLVSLSHPLSFLPSFISLHVSSYPLSFTFIHFLHSLILPFTLSLPFSFLPSYMLSPFFPVSNLFSIHCTLLSPPYMYFQSSLAVLILFPSSLFSYLHASVICTSFPLSLLPPSLPSLLPLYLFPTPSLACLPSFVSLVICLSVYLSIWLFHPSFPRSILLSFLVYRIMLQSI